MVQSFRIVVTQEGRKMYHIPNDARAQRSAERIYESLMTFQNAGTLSDISVTRIAACAGVGRSTFYRLFDNSYDVLYWKSDEIMECALHRASGMHSFDDIFLTFIEEWMEHQSLLQTLFRFSMTDILFRVHLGHIEEIETHFFHDMKLSRIQMEYLATTLSAMLSAGFGLWCRYPQTTPEELLASFRAALHHLNIMFGIQKQ